VVFVRKAAEEREAIVGSEGIGHVGVHEPDLYASAGRQRCIPVVGEICKSVIFTYLGRQARELGDAGAAPVGSHHQLGLQLALGAIAVFHQNAADPPLVAQQCHRPAQHLNSTPSVSAASSRIIGSKVSRLRLSP